MNQIVTRFCPFLSLCLLFALNAPAQPSPYFPEFGKTAVAQRSLDVRYPAVVVALWLEPGYEDFSTLAYLRLGLGARVISVYVSNGSETPSDLDNAPPFAVASLRREEAYRAMSRIDVESYFLCLPDIGVVANEDEVLAFWNPDTASARMKEVVRQFRPDLVLVGRDVRADSGSSPRFKALNKIVEQTVEVRAKLTLQGTPSQAWTAARILVDHGAANPANQNPRNKHLCASGSNRTRR